MLVSFGRMFESEIEIVDGHQKKGAQGTSSSCQKPLLKVLRDRKLRPENPEQDTNLRKRRTHHSAGRQDRGGSDQE